MEEYEDIITHYSHQRFKNILEVEMLSYTNNAEAIWTKETVNQSWLYVKVKSKKIIPFQSNN